ncbi:MAG: DMT family transporter [Halopenitus sp.]
MAEHAAGTATERDHDRVGVLLVLIAGVGFGTLGIFGTYAQQAGLSIPTVLLYRFFIATVAVWGILIAQGRLRLLRGRTLFAAIALGSLGYATMSGLFFLGLEYMTAGLVAIVFYTYPAFVVVLAVVAVGERVSRTTLLALALALGGVGLVVGADPAGASRTGVAIMIAAALTYAAYITVSRAVLETTDSLLLTAHVLPAAGLTFLVGGTITNELAIPATPTAWGILVGLALLGTAIPVFTFFAGLSRIGASRTGIISTAEPLVTVALGVVLFAEPVTLPTVAGGGLILSAVVLLQTA